ncbi:PqiB family protein [Paraburkholderia sp. D1E]|uniref:PqiB family protein n=1 Tax=Paraburkholderia sp. D1E TaxID=3461398 RepID=UPI004046449A
MPASDTPRSEPNTSTRPPHPSPDIEARDGWLPSLIWLIPLIAALFGIGLVIKAVTDRGPIITISFVGAEGLEPGKTKLKYKDVDIGSVKSVKLSKDLSHVLVRVELTRDARDFAVKDTRFWVVRPRIGAGGVSGLGTLLSGAYIGADAGRSTDTEQSFVGLETPPVIVGAEKGHRYTLHGGSLGSLDIGSPVFYRRVQVGRVVSFSLDKDGAGVTIGVFIAAPFDQYVGINSRWWHASGVHFQLDSGGFKLSTQSLATILVGGISFQAPPGESAGRQVRGTMTFRLASDEARAIRNPDGVPLHIVMNFSRTVRGLSIGAPVDFRGIVVGEVTHIGIDYDPRTRNFSMPVMMSLYPGRLGSRFRENVPTPGNPIDQELLTQLVKRGLRGQLRTGNLLTGQLYVALDVFPRAPAAKLDLSSDPIGLPTVPNTLDQLQTQVADIVRKLDKAPLDQIGPNLNGSLKDTDHLFRRLGTDVVPQARDTLVAAKGSFVSAEATLRRGSPLQSDVHQALQELTRTLESLNALADYLERHPESLVRGKNKDAP